MRMFARVNVEPALFFTHLQPKRAVEFLGIRDIRHEEIELIQRMHAELARTAAHRLGKMADLGHSGLLLAERWRAVGLFFYHCS
jgi:hypothetical protein